MMFDRMRLFDAGCFHDMDLPDLDHEAACLGPTERIDRQRAFEPVLDCEDTLQIRSSMRVPARCS